MSGSPEACLAGRAIASPSGPSNHGAAAQQNPPPPPAADEKPPATTTEKTISCVSCRKRKLKCDRVKPKCGTCTRLRHDCEYPERRRNPGSKRRNMKELEARLAQVETQLVSETAKSRASNRTPLAQDAETGWNSFPLDMHVDFQDETFMDQSFGIPNSVYSLESGMPSSDFSTQEVISLGLQEPLPPDEMVNDLHRLYFEKYHFTMPMMHKQRYLAALKLPAHMRPPVCLRYAMWALAATFSDKYSQYEDLLYERARRYAEAAEMKGHGESFVTIQHAQTWVLIATYEAKKTYFTRAWMSTGRMVRLVQMLGLHRLDGVASEVKQILPPARDVTELEERRRTFWAAFYGDRWASSGTGWAMIIQEKEIMTNLPSSEEAFEQGIAEQGITLQEALTPEGASKISPFGGVVLSACLFGHNFIHLHQGGPDDHPEDLANGEFWKRHRTMDNILSNTFMFLPEHLRMPAGLRDMNIVFLHMNIHASTICLHQAAIFTAERNKLDPAFIRQSRARSLMSAEEIVNIMRLVSHLDVADMNSWMGFCLYIAAGVFIQDQRSESRSSTSMSNLEFLLAAMKAIGNRHSITIHFTTQVELDIENSGIRNTGSSSHKDMPNTPINGIPIERDNVPMGIHHGFYAYMPNKDKPEFDMQEPLTPLLPGILPAGSRTASPHDSPCAAAMSNFGAGFPSQTRAHEHTRTPRNPSSTTYENYASPTTYDNYASPNPLDMSADEVNNMSSYVDIHQNSFNSASTPSTKPSNPRPMQFPYRQGHGPSDFVMFPQETIDSTPVDPSSEWTFIPTLERARPF